MIVVLDSSAAIELVLNRKYSTEIKDQLEKCSKVISSDLYKAETTNVFWKYVRANHMTKLEAIHYLKFTIHLIDEFHDMDSYQIEALLEGLRLEHSTYDMLFLVLAKRTGAVLLTMDKKLQTLAEREGVDVFGFSKNE